MFFYGKPQTIFDHPLSKSAREVTQLWDARWALHGAPPRDHVLKRCVIGPATGNATEEQGEGEKEAFKGEPCAHVLRVRNPNGLQGALGQSAGSARAGRAHPGRHSR